MLSPVWDESAAWAVIARHPRRAMLLGIDNEHSVRYLIQNFLCKLTELKRGAVRSGKTDRSFLAMTRLAAAAIHLR